MQPESAPKYTLAKLSAMAQDDIALGKSLKKARKWTHERAQAFMEALDEFTSCTVRRIAHNDVIRRLKKLRLFILEIMPVDA